MNINQVVDFLNEALKQDYSSVSKVFLNIEVVADDWMIEHPTVQVTQEGILRFVGMLNGIISDGHSCIQMIIDDDTGTIKHFAIGTLDQHNCSTSRV